MISDFDKKQLKKMRTLIIGFFNKNISLFDLISNLEFLFYSLENVDEEWEDFFLEEISTLESVNSGTPLGVSNKKIYSIVEEAVNSLNNLIEDRIN